MVDIDVDGVIIWLQVNAQADARFGGVSCHGAHARLVMPEISTGHLQLTTSAKDKCPHMRIVFIEVGFTIKCRSRTHAPLTMARGDNNYSP